MNAKKITTKTIEYLFYALTIAQVIFGLIWIANNFKHVYMWPETAEYLDIAWNFKIDEYEGIIYPFLVKYLYYIPMYVVQMILALTSTYLFLWKGIKLEQNKAIWGTLYVFSFPMLLQFHLSIRPESLRLSTVLFVITLLIYKKREWKKYVITGAILIALFLVIGAVQQTGARGRIQRTFWSMAFQRVCTEYYSQSFAAWDERTQDTYEIDEALEIIKRSDNVMYEIGPTMDSKWGLELANESYKEMTLTCLRIRTRDVCELIVNDLEDSFKLPFSILQQKDGVRRSQTGRNYEAFSSVPLKVNIVYWNYGIWSLIVLLIASFLKLISEWGYIRKNLKSSMICWELLAAFILQWLYKTLTTGDAVDYSKYLIIIAGWCILAIHLISGLVTGKNDENVVQ